MEIWGWLGVAGLIAAWLVGGIGSIAFGVYLWRDSPYDSVGKGLSVAIVVIGIAWLGLPGAVIKFTPDKPCVRYETTYQYNAATKTTMPVRYCAQYGEWLQP